MSQGQGDRIKKDLHIFLFLLISVRGSPPKKTPGRTASLSLRPNRKTAICWLILEGVPLPHKNTLTCLRHAANSPALGTATAEGVCGSLLDPPPPSLRNKKASRMLRGQEKLVSIVSLSAISSTFDSFFKVLCIFPSRYLCSIGLSSIFSLGWKLPPKKWLGLRSQAVRLFKELTCLRATKD